MYDMQKNRMRLKYEMIYTICFVNIQLFIFNVIFIYVEL